jgi:3-methyladenine DNA glycosylase AlkD
VIAKVRSQLSTNKTHTYHQEIVHDIVELAQREHVPYRDGDAYAGTTKACYPIRTPVFRQMARDWFVRHPGLTPVEYRQLLTSLAQGATANEYWFIGELLSLAPDLRATLDPHQVAAWLEHAQGWAEVDSLCQSKFTAEELLSNWKTWKSVLIALARSKNVHQRRASLVVLTGPAKASADARLAGLAFANIGRLQYERDILITKAVSWLLRNLAQHHRQAVQVYLAEHADSLPPVAIRETQNKLQTGRKSGQ